MSFKYAGQCVTFEAGQDLSSSQFYFVTVASDGQIDPTGDGAYANGVLQNDPAAAGRAATVQIDGISKVVASAAITVGAAVSSTAAGKAVTAATGDVILGTALEAASADGDIIAVHLEARGTA